MFIDILFFLLMLMGILKGMRKGLILSLFSFAGFFVGMAAAIKLSAVVANYAASSTLSIIKWLPALSFLLVFLAVVIVVNLSAKFIHHTAEWVMLGWVNRIAGVTLYILIYGMIYSIFLFYLVQLKLLPETYCNSSAIFPYIYQLAPAFINSLGKGIPIFQGLFTQLEGFFSSVSDKMSH